MSVDSDVATTNGHGPRPSSRRRRRRSRRSRRRVIAIGAIGLLVVVLVVGVLAALGLRSAAAALADARRAVTSAQAALTDGDLDTADAQFARAAERADDAARALRRPAVRALGVVPLARRNVETSRAIADSAADLAQAGGGVTAAVTGLPGGVASLAPTDGALQLEPLAAVAPALADAGTAVEAARARLDPLPTAFLVPQVAEARAELALRLEQLRRPAAAGAALAEALPGFLGADEPRRYVFGGQNPAELRGSGGLIGAWAELTVRDGRLEFGDFTTIGTLTLRGPEERGILPPPTNDFGQRWGRFAATTHGSNVNMSPHFPDVAEALLTLHAHHGNPRADGVIVADPMLFAAILELTGPVEIPDVGELRADGVTRFLAVEQYEQFPEDSPRKPLLGEVAELALERFLSGAAGDDPVRAFGGIAAPAAAGHLLLYSTRADEQEAFEAAGLAGAFPRTTPVLGVVVNNAGANKLDYFLAAEHDVDIWLDADGTGWASTTVRLRNDAPTSGFAKTVLGPNFDGVVAGENRLHVSVYCGACALQRAVRDGAATTASSEREFGHAVASTWENLESGATRELRFDWRIDDAWDPDEGRLRLVIPAQPAYDPPLLRVSMHAPSGRVVTVRGTTEVAEMATWRGPLDTRRELVVDVRRPSTLRGIASRLWDILDRPLFSR